MPHQSLPVAGRYRIRVSVRGLIVLVLIVAGWLGMDRRTAPAFSARPSPRSGGPEVSSNMIGSGRTASFSRGNRSPRGRDGWWIGSGSITSATSLGPTWPATEPMRTWSTSLD